MNGFMRLMIIGVLVAAIGCASRPSSDDDIVLGEGNSSESPQASADDLSVAETPPAEAAPAEGNAPADEFSEFNDEPAPAIAEKTPEPEPMPSQPEPMPTEATPEPLNTAEAMPDISEPMPKSEAPVELTSLKFKANDNGGTIILEGNRQFTYTTRSNPDAHQFIVEIPNSILPAKLKRNLNTKDIQGSIGSIDAYQNPNSNTSRIVVQLRSGVAEPAVQQEGRSLLIVASGGLTQPSSSSTDSASVPAPVPLDGVAQANGLNKELSDDKILTRQSLEDFLSGNMKFHGTPISIEVDNIEVTEALRFLASESGLNLIISEAIAGKVSLKLQNVPWDQALVVLLRAKKLGYVRQGSVIRIETLADLKAEEDDANKIAIARMGTESLKVKVFPVSYAKVDELAKSLKDFLSARGKIDADPRTASLLVTDISEGLDRITKLIAALDVQPPQVMIEGKIVEASESFGRQIGVSWGISGGAINLGTGKSGPVDLRPSLRIAPGGTVDQSGALGFGIHLGVLDFFGDLDANLRLNENESKVKIISSPQIVTLTNEPAKINQTTEIPYQETTLVPGAGSTVSTKFKALKMELNVTPQVTSDGSVMMKVQVQRELKAALDVTTGSFGVNSRTADTKILIKNGQTAVIGGIYSSDANESENRVPGLGSLPLIGGLFRYSTQTREKTELLIFLTPRILAGAQIGQDAKSFSTSTQ